MKRNTRKPREKKVTVETAISGFPNSKRRTKKNVGQTLEDFDGLTDKESVFESPDVYIDSVHRIPIKSWVYDFTVNRFVKVEHDIPLGLSRLFIEIISNACDNATRCILDGIDPKKIEIYMKGDTVTVINYGLPIPVLWKAEVGKWVPEWVLTNLKTGSNFYKKRHGGGKNGMGATLTGFFSLDSDVDIYDHLNHKHYYQAWSNGLDYTAGPRMEDYYGTESRTQFRYRVDLSRFGYPEQFYPEMSYNLFARIAADASFTCKIPVTFNGIEMNFSSILDYAKMFVPEVGNYVTHYVWPTVEEDSQAVDTCDTWPTIGESQEKTLPSTHIIRNKDGTEKSASNLEVPDVEMIIMDTPGFGMQIGLCNSIFTPDGGIHVTEATKYVSHIIKSMVNNNKDTEEKKAAGNVSKKMITRNVSIIINVRLPNPYFDGQGKGKLQSFIPDRKTGKPGKFSLNIPDNVKHKIMKWDLAENMKKFRNEYIAGEIKKAKGDGKRRHKGKNAEDCEWARSAKTRDRVWALFFEGESARSYARCVRTFTKDGSKKFILFSLGGKINNSVRVSEKNQEKLLANELFMEIIKFCGLTPRMDYTIPENFKTLRCQAGFMLMTDADADGLHIKMLVLAMFYKYFPSLLEMGMIYDWRTKIKTASRKGYRKIKFYSERQFEAWVNSLPEGDLGNWTIRYYKGLGTSSDKDAKEDVEEPWIVRLKWDPSCKQFFELTMAGKGKDSTKEWMMNYDPEREPQPIYNNEQWIYSFINDEFITYCLYTLSRNLPSFTDGLNDTRRRILWYASVNPKWRHFTACNEKTLVRLDEFAKFVEAHTKYPHGDLTGVVANMTQRFVGHNNMPLFNNEGQFGTRFEGGKDCASGRYPKLIPNGKLCRAIFPPENEKLLVNNIDEDTKIEWKTFYSPIPLVLITGWKGIAYGYSSTILPVHPLELINVMVSIISGTNINQLTELTPWYRDFKGQIYVEKNVIRKDDTYTANFFEEVTDTEELQDEIVGKHTFVSKGILEYAGDNKYKILELPIGVWTKPYTEKVLDRLVDDEKIKDYDTDSDIYNVNITVHGVNFKDANNNIREPTLEDFSLVRYEAMSNMVLLDTNGKPVKYNSYKHIIHEFYKMMLDIYQRRKDIILKEKEDELLNTINDRNYIQAVVDKRLLFLDKSEEETIQEVVKLNLSKDSHNKMKTKKLNRDGLRKISEKIEKLTAERDLILNTTIQQSWIEDLKKIWNAYVEIYGDDRPNRY